MIPHIYVRSRSFGRADGLGRCGVDLRGVTTLNKMANTPDPRHFYDERVRVQVPFRGAGTYALGVKDAWLEQITGGDAGYFPGATGELRVTRHDEAGARVRGTLRLTAAQHGFAWRFEDGSFDAPVYTRWEDVPRIRGP